MSLLSIGVLFLMACAIFFAVLGATKFDFSAPASIACALTILSILVMMLSAKNNGYELSLGTIAVVSVALLSFCASTILFPKNIINVRKLESIDLYRRAILVFTFVFIAVATVLYYKEVIRVASLSGYNSNSFYSFLYFYRKASTRKTEAMQAQSKLVGQMVIASYASAYLILVDFVKRIIFKRIKEDKLSFGLEILICVTFLTQCILSGGRTQFLYFIESFVFLLVFLYGKRNAKRIDEKMIRRLGVMLVVTFIVFYFLGGLTGKTFKYDILTTLFIYVGSPIVAFDALRRGDVIFDTSFWGSNTFYGIFEFLRKLGADIPYKEMAAPFVEISVAATNIYGSFARYYVDFGVVVMAIIMMLLGALYHYLYARLVCINAMFELRLAIFLVMMRAVYDYALEERFFLSIISLGTAYRVFYIVVAYYAFKLLQRIKFR